MQGSLGLAKRIAVSSVLLGTMMWLAAAQTFSLSFSAPTQCNDMSVSWTGGTPPFDLYLTPVYGTPRNISVPSSAWVNGRGSYSVQIPFKKGQQMVLSLLDATGVPSGGTSELLTVGAQEGGSSCNTTDPGVNFFYELNTPLVQCQPFTFSNYSSAVQPVKVMAIIPAENPVFIYPPDGTTYYNWTTSVTAGTSIIFVMTDSKGRQGGASNVYSVGYSSNSTCIDTATTSTPLIAPSQTSSAGTGNTSTNTSNHSTLAAGAIAGIIIASIVAAASLLLVILFYRRRRRDQASPMRLDLDLAQDPPFPRMSQLTPGVYEPTPFLLTVPPAARDRGQRSPSSPPTASGRTSYNNDDDHPRYLSPTSSSRARKTSEDPSSSRLSTSGHTMDTQRAPSMRVMVHQDAEDLLPFDGDADYVELPPQYREDRRRIPAPPGIVGMRPNSPEVFTHPERQQ